MNHAPAAPGGETPRAEERARLAVAEYAEARDKEYRIAFYGVPDEDCDRLCRNSAAAKKAAIDAILDAVPGPVDAGRWGGRYRGNRGIVVGDSLVVLLSPNTDPDEDHPNRDGELCILPLAAIAGLEGGAR